MSTSKHINRIAIFSTGVALGLSIISGAASAAAAPSHDPSGNNGTMKVDGLDADDTPGNEPHVGCSFHIDFFGFDEGARADIRFFAQPPSGEGQVLDELLDVLISDDDAAGGPNDVDTSLPYNAHSWEPTTLSPSPQGYHVKVQADVVGARGGPKQKVFWVDCGLVGLIPPIVIEREDVDIEDDVVVEGTDIVEGTNVVVEGTDIVVEGTNVVVEDTKVVIDNAVVVTIPVSPEVGPVLAVMPGSAAIAAVGSETRVAQLTAPSVGSERSVPAVGTQPPQAQVLGLSLANANAATLPRTGVDSGALVLVAGLLLAVGTVLTRLDRAPSPARVKATR